MLRSGFSLYRMFMRRARHSWMSIAILGIALPATWQLVFSARLERVHDMDLLLGNSLLGLFFMTTRTCAYGIVTDRELGCQKLLEAMPISRGAFLCAHSLDALTRALIPFLFLQCGALLLGSQNAQPAWAAAVFFLTAAVFVGIGISLGALCSSLASAALSTNLLFVGMLALCPVMYRVSVVPNSIRPVVELLPFTASAEALRQAYEGRLPDARHLGSLIAWALALLGAGYALTPWGARRSQQGGDVGAVAPSWKEAD